MGAASIVPARGKLIKPEREDRAFLSADYRPPALINERVWATLILSNCLFTVRGNEWTRFGFTGSRVDLKRGETFFGWRSRIGIWSCDEVNNRLVKMLWAYVRKRYGYDVVFEVESRNLWLSR